MIYVRVSGDYLVIMKDDEEIYDYPLEWLSTKEDAEMFLEMMYNKTWVTEKLLVDMARAARDAWGIKPDMPYKARG